MELGSASAFVYALDKAIKYFCTDFPQETMWVPWEATHQLIKSNQAISCSESILGRGHKDKCMPFCPLPKNQSSKSVKSHELVITCVHIILKKNRINQYLDLFALIFKISDLIDDLINLIKSMPTLTLSCTNFSVHWWKLTENYCAIIIILT